MLRLADAHRDIRSRPGFVGYGLHDMGISRSAPFHLLGDAHLQGAEEDQAKHWSGSGEQQGIAAGVSAPAVDPEERKVQQDEMHPGVQEPEWAKDVV